MRRIPVLLTACLLSWGSVSHAQSPSTQNSQGAKPEDMAREWFIRLNELDDWYISFDGKEENDAVVDRFLELYAPDASHQVGPSERQIGAVIFHGKDAIRKWADGFSKKFTALNYRVEYKTRKEHPLQPFYVIQFPWGGTGAATQFEAIYTNREDRRQFVVPAAVFFMFDEAGKIQNVRLYMLRDEAAEIG
ncbi:MAG TPA: nuclear transport factor 2 family protein [Vicinamibacterales bacterium]